MAWVMSEEMGGDNSVLGTACTYLPWYVRGMYLILTQLRKFYVPKRL